MRGVNPSRWIALSVSTLTIAAVSIAAVSLPIAAPAATTKVKTVPALPVAITNVASHVLGTSALLQATIRPNGKETTYFFQYGLTTAYGSQTVTASAGSGTVKLKVGQAISGLQPGVVYHYRVVAANSAGRREGRDRTFTTGGSKLRFVIPKPAPDVYGRPIILSGTLTGFAGPNHRIALQASPYPYLESFASIGLPGVTDRFGHFAFRVANLSSNTQFRVITMDPLPVYSPVVTVQLAVRVSFNVRSNPRAGLVRLFGTVTPAAPGARVQFQLLKAVRPGKNEEPTRYVTQFTTSVKHGGRTFSRFSMVVKIRRGGRYRVSVKVRPGPLSSGVSTRTIVLHASPSAGAKK